MRDGNGVRRHREKKTCGATLFQFRSLTRHDNSAFWSFFWYSTQEIRPLALVCEENWG